MTPPPLVSVAALEKHFGGQNHVFGQQDVVVRAVDGLSLDISKGEVVGLVGESGSGKTTVGRMVLRLTDPTNGRILFDGQDITAISQRRMLPVRRRMQMVFQDPFASLNPRLTVGKRSSSRCTSIGSAMRRIGRTGWRRCWSALACPASHWAAIRTSSQAANGSASSLREPWL